MTHADKTQSTALLSAAAQRQTEAVKMQQATNIVELAYAK